MPLSKIRASVIHDLADKVTDEEQKAWCNAVKANTPPGQIVHADSEMLAKCQAASGQKTKLLGLAELRALPIADLVDGATEKAFVAAGIKTVGQVLDHSGELSSINGIGPERGKDTIDAIKAIASPEAIKASPKLT